MSEQAGAVLAWSPSHPGRVLLEKLVARIAALHPYDEPAILGGACDAAPLGTVRWLEELVAGPG